VIERNRKRAGNGIIATLAFGALFGLNYGFAHACVEGSLIGWTAVLRLEAIVLVGSFVLIVAVNLSCGLPWHGIQR
jgi:hypothetical protein